MVVNKRKSKSDNKEVVNCKITDFLLKFKPNEKETAVRSSLLIFPETNGTNNRHLPSIYKKKNEEKEEKEIKSHDLKEGYNKK